MEIETQQPQDFLAAAAAFAERHAIPVELVRESDIRSGRKGAIEPARRELFLYHVALGKKASELRELWRNSFNSDRTQKNWTDWAVSVIATRRITDPRQLWMLKFEEPASE